MHLATHSNPPHLTQQVSAVLQTSHTTLQCMEHLRDRPLCSIGNVDSLKFPQWLGVFVKHTEITSIYQYYLNVTGANVNAQKATATVGHEVYIRQQRNYEWAYRMWVWLSPTRLSSLACETKISYIPIYVVVRLYLLNIFYGCTI